MQTDYLRDVLTPTRLRKTVQAVVALLRPRKGEFDAIAFCGVSGALVAPIAAYRLHKRMLVVRKPGEIAHSLYHIEGSTKPQRVLILDDFIASGETIRYIATRVRELNDANTIVGALEWRHIAKCSGLRTRLGDIPLWTPVGVHLLPALDSTAAPQESACALSS